MQRHKLNANSRGRRDSSARFFSLSLLFFFFSFSPRSLLLLHLRFPPVRRYLHFAIGPQPESPAIPARRYAAAPRVGGGGSRAIWLWLYAHLNPSTRFFMFLLPSASCLRARALRFSPRPFSSFFVVYARWHTAGFRQYILFQVVHLPIFCFHIC